MSQLPTGIYTFPPLILSQDISQSYWPWSGYVPSTQTQPLPTSPGQPATNELPTFAATTNELDKFRALFLVLGVLIGAFVLGRK